ncbi:MAG: methyl-accepting chemotaxis protein [Pseudomonadota bacterium]|nr:methyl-accepting chemotaxis protein [Pseudomonadota bacterium]
MDYQTIEMDVSGLGSIVSKTDLNGTILEVNEAFIEASGYTEKELIGQPHNILRHPDVPKAVFKDMWQTLQSGKPWVQIVKNRCKDGRYYWVEANVTPVVKEGEVIGFQSVRTAVNESTKEAAQSLYQEINRGRKVIKNGYVVDVMKRICLFNRFHPINLMLIFIAVLGAMATLIQAGLLSLPVEFMALLSLGLLLYAWSGKKYVFNRLGKAKSIIDKMREGDFTGQLDSYGQHSLSKLTSAVKMMQVQLGAMYDDSQDKLNRSTRLKSALDTASTNIMMVNKLGIVTYLNDQMKLFFESHQESFKQSSADFDFENMVSQKLESVCNNEFFFDLTVKKQKEVLIAGLIIDLKVLPVFGQSGTRIGSVIEWRDLTQQRKIEENLKLTLEMASIGHTDIHIETDNLSGFYLDTSKNVNLLLSELNGIIESMVFLMTKLAVGDLRGRLEKDLQGSLAAMKGATNVSLDNLSSIIFYIKQAADTVKAAAEESSKASFDLSDRTQQAAATLEEVNASMQMMSNLQAENTKELTEVNSSAKQTVLENGKAKQSLSATVQSIEEIQQTSEKIASIISIIDGIAFQTNLLALNAAVEAARAGEHGRGFAVVAGEVRSLAQKSAEAAQDIKHLIDDSVVKVKEGVSKVNETNQAFEVVDSRVLEMGSAMDKVLGSIQEQQTSVTEIAHAISDLDSNIQSNAALVEQTSAASTSLKEQALLLNSETSKFQIDDLKAQSLIQNTSDVFGVRMADVRQNMRIWRTTVQSYLNGIKSDLDIKKAEDPQTCGVGMALSQLLTADPSIEALNEFKVANELHVRQHQLVQQVALMMEEGQVETGEDLKEKDRLLDLFVETTGLLDEALAELDRAIIR